LCHPQATSKQAREKNSSASCFSLCFLFSCTVPSSGFCFFHLFYISARTLQAFVL
jgi:hypothetical protein